MDSIQSSSEQFIELCRAGNNAQLVSLFTQPSNIQTALSYEEVCLDDETGVTRSFLNLQRMLAAAARAGEAETVELLLNFGKLHGIAVPDMLDRETAEAALHKNSVPVLRKFVAVDPDILSRPLHMGRRMLEAACAGGPNSEPLYRGSRLDLLKYLLENGQDPNMIVSPQSKTPGYLLYTATWMASLEVVDCLLEHGATITGSGALRMAATRGRIDVLESFLRHGADLNECVPKADHWGPGGTPLHTAVSHKQIQTVQWLLEHHADPKVRNEEGKTAGDIASAGGDLALRAIFENLELHGG